MSYVTILALWLQYFNKLTYFTSASTSTLVGGKEREGERMGGSFTRPLLGCFRRLWPLPK